VLAPGGCRPAGGPIGAHDKDDAVRSLRAYLNPTLDEAATPEPAVPPEPIAVAPTQVQADEVMDDLGHSWPARQVLADLGHDPRALLDRLRAGPARG
jgi:hypothetical protein